jgi:hypothetical protein
MMIRGGGPIVLRRRHPLILVSSRGLKARSWLPLLLLGLLWLWLLLKRGELMLFPLHIQSMLLPLVAAATRIAIEGKFRKKGRDVGSRRTRRRRRGFGRE